MGLEISLERIADALESMVRILEWNKARISAMLGLDPGPGEAAAESSGTEELSRDELLKRCADLGIEVAKGTKTSTLGKLIAEAEAKKPASAAEEPKAETKEEEEVDPFEEEAPEVLMTQEEFRKAMTDICERGMPNAGDQKIIRGILQTHGATKISEVKPEERAAVVEEFRKAKGK